MAKTMKELLELCKGWETAQGPDAFKEVVASYLAVTGNQQRVLADEFEAAISTVSRWANGQAKPRPRMQREIVGWIKRRADAAVKAAEPPVRSASSWTPPPSISMAAKSR